MLSFRNVLAGAAIAISATVAMYAFQPTPVDACLHPPREFKIPIKADAQKGLIFFVDGYQETVIRPGYKLDTEGMKVKNDAVEGFTTIAWLIPTPNLPDNYKEADAAMFSKLEEFTKPEENVGLNSAQEDGVDSDKLEKHGAEFLEEVVVGDYKIQPIKASGELGVLEMKGWLKDNGFGEPTDKALRHYTDAGHYWLAVKLHNPKGLPANGEVKPLQIGFKTDKPVYPLRIYEGGGTFDLEMWVISDREVDTEKSKAYGLQTVEQRDVMMHQANRKTTYVDLPEEVRKIADDTKALAKLKKGDLHVCRFFAAGINDTIKLSEWKTDLTLEFKTVNETKKD
ncbi:MAG: DUF2330 domain-containing protein [Planctomycetes bacterium]|nr:DUF2330 domain-containing protein [Planctomycetota bacterium]